MRTLFETTLSSLKLRFSGKVRDVYDIHAAQPILHSPCAAPFGAASRYKSAILPICNAEHMLIVTTDRISAFDVVLPDPIPGKGRVLTSLSNFWFARTSHIIANHLASMSLEQAVPDAADRAQVEGRAIVVKKLKPLPVEAIVRGYLIGSGWNDYQKTGTVCGIALPQGLRQAEKLPDAIYTPSAKAERGTHDENITFVKTVELLGAELAAQVRDLSLQLYTEAADYARQRGIIIADTKFEFGQDESGKLYLIDEVLTPDSSRFWPVDQYKVGISPPSFDKQYLRDYLETLGWNKQVPGPYLPEEVVNVTAQKYREAEIKLVNI